MPRGHAAGPFQIQGGDVFPVLRVQKQWLLISGQSQTIYIDAATTPGPNTGPVLLKFQAYVATAAVGGTTTLIVGNSGNTSFYLASGDSTPGSTGFNTEKKFVLTAPDTIIATMASVNNTASGVLTITAITGANTQTVAIGGQTYTFNTTLTNTANNVLIGASTTTQAANLASAINAGAGSGTTYGAGTVANASVTATSALGVLTVTAINSGAGANAVATTETLTNASWANTTLTGGSNADTVGQIYLFMDA